MSYVYYLCVNVGFDAESKGYNILKDEEIEQGQLTALTESHCVVIGQRGR